MCQLAVFTSLTQLAVFTSLTQLAVFTSLTRKKQIGVREVIQGWDLGILGTPDGSIPPMKEGGKRRLVIPSGMATLPVKKL